jgi:hypothetical protein
VGTTNVPVTSYWKPDKPFAEWSEEERHHVWVAEIRANKLNAARREHRRLTWSAGVLVLLAFPFFSPVFWGLPFLLYNQAPVRPMWACS